MTHEENHRRREVGDLLQVCLGHQVRSAVLAAWSEQSVILRRRRSRRK